MSRHRRPLKALFPIGLLLFSLVPLAVALSAWAMDWTLVSESRLLAAETDSDNWLMVNRTHDSKRYSPLSQINTKNVKNLVPKWTFSIGTPDRQESTPVVNNGIMIVTGSWSKLYALDARTGALLWKREATLPSDLPELLCCGVVNRGVAVLGGTIYWGTPDAHLLALDARTGRVVWDVTVEDYKTGYTLTGAPLIVKGKVVIGLGGGEYGIRGFLQAFDARTGQSAWKTYTVPAPGEPGSETWPKGSDVWKHGGGSTWVTGSYDPVLNLVYWGTGNPGPAYNGWVRPGKNLYTGAVLALDADSGHIRWHFQWTPHDVWEYDGVNEMILVDRVKRPDGSIVDKGLIHADRNGHFYLLDRTTGKVIYARPFIHVDTIKVDPETGEVTPLKRPKINQTIVGCGHGTAGKSWQPMSFNPDTGMAYVPAVEMCAHFSNRRVIYEKGKQYLGGSQRGVSPGWGHLTAIDVGSGQTVWEYVTKFPMYTGTVTTAGGLVFAGNPGGELMALGAKAGELLWRFRIGSAVVAGPIVFAIDGKQYVAAVAGLPIGPSGALGSGGLQEDIHGSRSVPGRSVLIVFGLPE
jgi:alcohol dehydrogenase (cytochrome c)